MNNVQHYLQAGFSLVPIPFGEKGPRIPDWNLRENCVFDAEGVRALVGANVGLAHAYSTPPTCALDVDHYKRAKKWLATHGIDLDKLILAEGAAAMMSGKRFSLKLFYRLPPGVAPLESKKINGPDGKSALEFRCGTKDGKTVQDVLPPSMHPDGHVYQWVGDGDPLNIPEIPAELLAIWQMLIVNGSRVASRKFAAKSRHQREETPRQVAIVIEALDHISADCGYELWRNVVWAILSTGWLCAEDLARSWSMSAPDSYDEDAFWVVVNSYMPDHVNPITLGTIYHHARQGGWND